MDFTTYDVLPSQIGSYRLYMGGGLWGSIPIYGTRNELLDVGDMFQVQIKGFGGLYWINVNKDDISLK
jgi:hypothetical protein